MSSTFSHIFLYLAGIYLLNSFTISLARRFKINDFVANIVTGVLLAALIAGWGSLQEGKPFQQQYQITDSALLVLQEEVAGDSAIFAGLARLKMTPVFGEQAFVDSLEMAIGAAATDSLGLAIVKSAAVPESTEMVLLYFLTYVGLLLFLMQLGANVDVKFLKQNDSWNILLQMAVVLVLSAGVLTVSGLLWLFPGRPGMTAIFVIGFLSLNIGLVLAAGQPMNPRFKKPFSTLIHIAVLLDALVIAVFSGYQIYVQYRGEFWEHLTANWINWLLLIGFVLLVPLYRHVRQLFQALQQALADFAVLFKVGLVLLFFFVSFQAQLPMLLAGVWAGVLLKLFTREAHFEIRQRLFANASFLSVLPFVDMGRYLFQPGAYAVDFWHSLGIILLALAVISLLMGLFWFTRKDYPLVMALGTFPRGEITLIILWLLKIHFLIPLSTFIVLVIAVVLSSLLGGLFARYLLVQPIERSKKLKIS